MVRMDRAGRKTMTGFAVANLPQSEVTVQSDIRVVYPRGGRRGWFAV